MVHEVLNVCGNHTVIKYSGQKSEKHNLQFVSAPPVTLKLAQSHQIWYESVDPKQGHVG